MKSDPIIGWDVGGAHLKAALLDPTGQLLQVIQVPCALWRGLNELETAIDDVMCKFALSVAQHAVTMTGELVDLFTNRQTGVSEISRVMNAKLIGTKLFYTGALNSDFSGFVPYEGASMCWQHIASANWLASASFVAKQVEQGLLIDVGSTTTDFVLVSQHRPICLGLTDAARMQTEELVYAGVIRTPLMAVSQKISFQNAMTSVAAEYFSTTGDVYRLTSDLAIEDDMAETADGKDKTIEASAQRIARMIGRDADDASLEAWIGLAQAFKQLQLARLGEVAIKHIARLNNSAKVCIVGAGAGSFLARELAANLGVQYLEVADLLNDQQSSVAIKSLKHWAGVCLPAYAVAYLAMNNKNTNSI